MCARSPSCEQEVKQLPDGGMIIRNNKLRRLREQAQAQSSDTPKPRKTEPPKENPIPTSFLYQRYLKERRETKRIAKQLEVHKQANKIAKQKAMEKSGHYKEHKRQMKVLRANTEHLLNKIQFLKGR
ncbi:hypothetical protein O0L34_g567 [Tuta absoluta]|nr:hypothetical protein O0L34_g567 [Tuta absoluta]